MLRTILVLFHFLAEDPDIPLLLAFEEIFKGNHAVFTAAGDILHHMFRRIHRVLGNIIIFQSVDIGKILAVIVKPAGFIQTDSGDYLLLICPDHPGENMIFQNIHIHKLFPLKFYHHLLSKKKIHEE